MALSSGDQLGHYTIQSVIGPGMVEVYRAVDTKLEREVAMKMLPAASEADSERLDRFVLFVRERTRAMSSSEMPAIADQIRAAGV
jgi:hypothetical protein